MLFQTVDAAIHFWRFSRCSLLPGNSCEDPGAATLPLQKVRKKAVRRRPMKVHDEHPHDLTFENPFKISAKVMSSSQVAAGLWRSGVSCQLWLEAPGNAKEFG